MYYMFMGTMQIPIPPESLQVKINNKNDTIDLLGQGEVNIVRKAGLSDISFKMMLPNSNYPFNGSLLMKSRHAEYYLSQLENMKVTQSPFQFIVVRMKESGEMLQMTNITVTLEDYVIDESADYGYDAYANIELKQWRDWGTKRISKQTDQNGDTTATVESQRNTNGHVMADTTKATKGTTLQRIVKQNFGNTNNLFAIASVNKVVVPAVLAVGQVINLKGK